MLKKIIFIFFYFSIAFANTDAFNLENKIKGDLSSMISKVISKDDFFLTVNSTYNTRRVREVVEGESISQNKNQNVNIPPLPGFDPPLNNKPETKRDRQVYKITEKKSLKSIFVQLSVNNKIDDKKQEQIKTITSNYLGQNYPRKTNLNFQSIEMRKPESQNTQWPNLLPWILGGLFLLILAAMFFFRPRREQTKQVSPSEVYPYKGHDEISEAQFAEPDRSLTSGPTEPGQGSIPGSTIEGPKKIPALPASERYIDMRSELLKLFSENSDVFRIYFQNLNENYRNDIIAALKGPAFASLLKTLNVQSIQDEDVIPPSEDSLLFYCKDFKEFIDMHKWQKNQFFGFLHQLTQGQLMALFKDQNPLIAALMLKFLNSGDAAKILDQFDSEKRIEVLAETSRVEKIPSEELSNIEKMVRDYVDRLPKLLSLIHI